MHSNPQPAKSGALSATENKQQTIITITCDRVLVTGAAPTPVTIFEGIVMERRYLETIHNEVDPIISRQVVDAAAQGAK